MDKLQIEQLSDLLENISLNEWKTIKECVDREFSAQASYLRFKKRDSFRKNLTFELNH